MSSACRASAWRVVLDERGALQEVAHAERRGEAGAAAGRQDVAGTGEVVADRLGGVVADEDRAGAVTCGATGARVGEGDPACSGASRFTSADRLGHGATTKAPPLLQRLARRSLAWAGRPAGWASAAAIRSAMRAAHARPGSGRRSGSCSACASRSAATQAGFGAGVGGDDHLGGAGDHVDADVAEDEALGRGDVGVARADDLVDPRDALGAVGEGGDRLGAADGEDPSRPRRPSAAARVSGDGPGVSMRTSLTPATLAGTAVMNTVEG